MYVFHNVISFYDVLFKICVIIDRSNISTTPIHTDYKNNLV
jgi:hypothetical protein